MRRWRGSPMESRSESLDRHNHSRDSCEDTCPRNWASGKRPPCSSLRPVRSRFLRRRNKRFHSTMLDQDRLPVRTVAPGTAHLRKRESRSDIRFRSGRNSENRSSSLYSPRCSSGSPCSRCRRCSSDCRCLLHQKLPRRLPIRRLRRQRFRHGLPSLPGFRRSRRGPRRPPSPLCHCRRSRVLPLPDHLLRRLRFPKNRRSSRFLPCPSPPRRRPPTRLGLRPFRLRRRPHSIRRKQARLRHPGSDRRLDASRRTHPPQRWPRRGLRRSFSLAPGRC